MLGDDMKKEKEYKNIIFTKDYNFAYKVRQKCNEYGMEIHYVDNINDLMDYFAKNKKGTIFIDLKYSHFVKILNDFMLNVFYGQYMIVYLTDHRYENVNDDNKVIYLSCYNRLGDILPMLALGINKMNFVEDTQKRNTIINKITQILKSFDIYSNLEGFTFIKDCVEYVVINNLRCFVYKNDVYAVVARANNTTIACVEKNIRFAIKKAITSNPEAFNIDDNRFRKLTTTGFISYIIDLTRDFARTVVAN